LKLSCIYFKFILFSIEQLLVLNIHKRKYIRSRVTKHHSKLAGFSGMPANEQSLMLKTLNDLKTDLISINEDVQFAKMEHKVSDDDMAEELQRCGEYDALLREAIHELESLTAPDPPVAGPPPRTLDATRSLLRSPTAPLPRFTSEPGESLETFLESFEDRI